MKPVINVEEAIGKTVGRRTQASDPLSIAGSRKKDMERWRDALGGLNVPRGVYRFSSHEEADEWLWQMMTCQRPR